MPLKHTIGEEHFSFIVQNGVYKLCWPYKFYFFHIAGAISNPVLSFSITSSSYPQAGVYLHFPKWKKLYKKKCKGFRKTGKPRLTWLTGSYTPDKIQWNLDIPMIIYILFWLRLLMPRVWWRKGGGCSS